MSFLQVIITKVVDTRILNLTEDSGVYLKLWLSYFTKLTLASVFTHIFSVYSESVIV